MRYPSATAEIAIGAACTPHPGRGHQLVS
jgi:hypothetical protein